MQDWIKNIRERYEAGSSRCPLAARRNLERFQGVLQCIEEAVATNANSLAPQELEDYLKSIFSLSLWDDPMFWSKIDIKDLGIKETCYAIEDMASRQESNIRIACAILGKSNNKSPSPGISETEMEDAYHTVDSLRFTGSQKQIDWAKDIALKNLEQIVLLLRENKQVPTSAKWWIDNR